MIKLRSSLLFTSAITIATCVSLLSAKTITSTIVVKAGQTYDGKGETIVCKGMGDGGQGESQKPVFKLEKGAKLKNVKLGFPACDGVHCYGSNTIEDVTWLDIGEDALTVKASSGVNDKITVSGGSATKGDDKCFQINAACTFTVKNFKATTIGKLIRQNGGKTFEVKIFLENVTVENAKHNIVRTDSKSTTCTCSGKNSFNKTSSPQFEFPSSSQVKGCDSNNKTDIISSNLVPSKKIAAVYHPSTNSLQLSKPASNLTVAVMSLNGKQLMSEHIVMSGSKTQLSLPLQQIKSGSYVLKTTIDGVVSTQNISLY